MTKTNIAIGTPVTFDSDEGPQSGTVQGIKPHLGNGQKFALVKVPGTLNGEPWAMPVDQLRPARAQA